jgi:hypothetical protein
MLLKEVLAGTNEVRIKAATQSAICRDNQQKQSLLGTDLKKGVLDILKPVCQAAEDVTQLIGIGPRAHNAFLCAPQLRSRNRLHCFCKLLSVLYRPDAAADIQKARHIRRRAPFRL